MKTEESQIDDICVLKLFDRIDASSAQTLKETVQQLIKEEKTRLLIDMGDVTFIDSSGLGMLITCLKTTRNTGGQLKLANISQNIQSVFDTTRMDRIFEIFASTGEAIKSFKIGV